ncbi:MAG: nucleotidyl transferase AbiEii/AbiGii toxin family protein [Candidatus Rokuibacteriota bacterium]
MRLSVDLDLNYVGAVDREEMLREKPDVERALRLLGEGDHYQLQWGRDEHAGRKIYLRYRNGLGSDDHIELDVNFLHRIPLVPAVERDGWTPDPDLPCRAVLAGTEEILAGKILALLDRGAPRDLHDVASMAGGRFPYDADLFRPLFVALSGVLDRAVIAYAVPHRPTLSQAELDEQLIPVLRGGERPNQAALTASITPLVSSLVTLSDPEREYIERIPVGRVSSRTGCH